jgi:5-methylcytosine-specific restriction endonuclease McrA
VSDVQWERLEPAEPCASPDGHDYVDVMSPRSRIPARCLCPLAAAFRGRSSCCRGTSHDHRPRRRHRRLLAVHPRRRVRARRELCRQSVGRTATVGAGSSGTAKDADRSAQRSYRCWALSRCLLKTGGVVTVSVSPLAFAESVREGRRDGRDRFHQRYRADRTDHRARLPARADHRPHLPGRDLHEPERAEQRRDGAAHLLNGAALVRAKRVCAEPGCPALTDGGRCVEHRRDIDRQRTNRAAGRPWRRLRASVLASDGICWLCGEPGADSADHVTPRAHGGALLDPNNVRPAHLTCNLRRGTRPPGG